MKYIHYDKGEGMDKNKREENMSAASDKGINLTLKQAFERGK